jgi:hypothetical protein
MVWDVAEAWGNDRSARPVIRKPKGNRVPSKPPPSVSFVSDCANASDDSNDSDVFRDRQNRQIGNVSCIPHISESFPAAKTAKTVKAERHSWL